MLVRKNILEVTPYIAGKPIEETKRQLGLREVIKLASNENPLGVSPRARRAIRLAASGVNRYPDSNGFYLKKRLARALNLAPENFVLGNGSDELIDIIVKAFTQEGEAILTSEVTFLEYEIIAQILGRRVVKVPLRYFKYDVEGIKKRIDAKTKIIFIANPNNPTGTYLTRYEVEGLIDALPPEAILVLDEAYDAFIDVDDFPDSRQYLKKNLIILKTFSKAYGLAGLRVGYAIARQELAAYMERCRQPFNVNALAQAAGIAALDDKKFLRQTRRAILQGKAYLYGALSDMGLAYVPSVANFILIDAGRDGMGVFREMLKYGVIVRDMKQYGLKNFIRVTIGTKKENERFVKVLKKVL